MFVIASSLGLVVGGPLWSWLIGKGFRPVFILAGLASMSAAILALIIEALDSVQSMFVHAPVFLLATLGYQAVTQGRTAYLDHMTTEEERPSFISITQTLLGALSIGVAALFGVLAQANSEVWPVVAILAMNAAAVHSSLSRLRRALTLEGTLVITGGEGGGRWLGGTDRQIRAMMLSPFVRQKLGTFINKENYEDLLVLKELIESGKVTPVIDRTYPLSEVPEAIRYLEEGHAQGKVVIAVRSEPGREQRESYKAVPPRL